MSQSSLTLLNSGAETKDSTSCHDSSTAYGIMVLTMVIGCFGFVLNIFSFFVWKEHRHKIATHYYLLALAISDSFATLFDGIIDGLDCITGAKLFASNQWTCLTDLGLDFLSTFATYWVVTLIAVDRCLGLMYPQSYKTRISKPVTAYVSLGLTMGIVYGCGTFLIIGAVRTAGADSTATDDCGMSEVKGYRQFLLYGSIILGALTPLVIVLASTVIILYEIRKQQRTLSVRESSTIKADDEGKKSFIQRALAATSLQLEERRRSRATTSSTNSEQLSDFRNLTIAISVVFVIFCGAAQCLTAYSHGVLGSQKTHPVADALDELFNVLNSSSNFILYFLSSRLFRTEMHDFVYRLRDRFMNLWRHYFKRGDNKSVEAHDEARPESEPPEEILEMGNTAV